MKHRQFCLNFAKLVAANMHLSHTDVFEGSYCKGSANKWISDLCEPSFWLDLPTLSILQETGTFWEVGFYFGLTILLADYFIITENGRDCDWLIFIYDKYTEWQRFWCLGRFKREASFSYVVSSFSELELPLPLIWEGNCGELLSVFEEPPLTIAFFQQWLSSDLASGSLTCESQKWKGKAQHFLHFSFIYRQSTSTATGQAKSCVWSSLNNRNTLQIQQAQEVWGQVFSQIRETDTFL